MCKVMLLLLICQGITHVNSGKRTIRPANGSVYPFITDRELI